MCYVTVIVEMSLMYTQQICLLHVYFRDFVYKLNAENIQQVRRLFLCEVSLTSNVTCSVVTI